MRTLGILALVLLSAAPYARADASDEARTTFQHGMALYALHKFAEAAKDFEHAFELKPDPAILYNAAQAHRFAGNKQRALELYESYIRLYGDQPNATEVSGHIKDLKAAIEVEHQATNAPPTTSQPMSSSPTPSVTPAPAPEATPAAVVVAPGPRDDGRKPLVKKPWFWVVVGGAVVVAATGIALGVTLGSSTKNPTPTYGAINGN